MNSVYPQKKKKKKDPLFCIFEVVHVYSLQTWCVPTAVHETYAAGQKNLDVMELTIAPCICVFIHRLGAVFTIGVSITHLTGCNTCDVIWPTRQLILLTTAWFCNNKMIKWKIIIIIIINKQLLKGEVKGP